MWENVKPGNPHNKKVFLANSLNISENTTIILFYFGIKYGNDMVREKRTEFIGILNLKMVRRKYTPMPCIQEQYQ